MVTTPFVLEMDTTTTPWSLADVTAQVTQEGTQALAEKRSAQRQQLDEAALALEAQLRTRAHDAPMLKKEAEAFLREQRHLTSRQARGLLENGYNHDVYPEGLWVLRTITGQRGHPTGVYLTASDPRACAGGGIIDVRNKGNSGDPHEKPMEDTLISHTRMSGGVRNTAHRKGTNSANFPGADFVHPPDSGCPKSAPLTPAENLGETEGGLFRTPSPIPAEPVFAPVPEGECLRCGADHVMLVQRHGQPACVACSVLADDALARMRPPVPANGAPSAAACVRCGNREPPALEPQADGSSLQRCNTCGYLLGVTPAH
jgi:hypothetical protein